MNSKTTLVVGGTGKTGRRVVERLKARGLPVRVGSRSSEPSFDWNDQGTWAPALEDVCAVYVTYYPDLAAPGAAKAIQAFVDLAETSGKPRLVLLSGRGEEEAQLCEEIVRKYSGEWTLVRASWFAQNFSESYFLEPILAGEVVLPAGPIGEPFVDTDDIADVVVAALTEDRHVGQLYEVTGPRLLTFAEGIAEIGRATGREIRYVQIPVEEYASALKGLEVPPEVVELITYLFSEVLDGRNASTADGVMQALGRPAKDFSDYVRATAATGIWDARAS
jgi:uncharacterized protein YbjT (DUF2867 family)